MFKKGTQLPALDECNQLSIGKVSTNYHEIDLKVLTKSRYDNVVEGALSQKVEIGGIL
jgi:hypothetical protein